MNSLLSEYKIITVTPLTIYIIEAMTLNLKFEKYAWLPDRMLSLLLIFRVVIPSLKTFLSVGHF